MISPRAKKLAKWIALFAALTGGALVVAIVLFVEIWWAGLICLAVSLICGACTVTLYMAYRADRRKNATLTLDEEEDAKILRMMSPLDGADSAKNGDSPASFAPANVFQDESPDGEANGYSHSTLEARPPRRIMSVEQANELANRGVNEDEKNTHNDKNEG